MRSQSLSISLARTTPLGFDFGPDKVGRRTLTITPNGTVNLDAFASDMDVGSPNKTYSEVFHLDTDDGFARFVDLLTESAQRAKADEIKTALYSK